MERKIGEIFDYNGEWYQGVECDSCGKCSLRTTECGSGTKSDIADEVFGECSKVRRTDNKHAIFKKLEKVGEPFTCNYYGDSRLIMMQEYKVYNTHMIYENDALMYVVDKRHGRIAIEIKQNKEDMKENRKLKPFDLEAAKAGKPVCTRNGRKARIICFDKKDKEDIYPIVFLIEEDKEEQLYVCTLEGACFVDKDEHPCDLMMLPERKEGWINIYTSYDGIETGISVYETKEIAKKNTDNSVSYLDTIKIEWRSSYEEIFIAFISISYTNKLLYKWRSLNCCKRSTPQQ